MGTVTVNTWLGLGPLHGRFSQTRISPILTRYGLFEKCVYVYRNESVYEIPCDIMI